MNVWKSALLALSLTWLGACGISIESGMSEGEFAYANGCVQCHGVDGGGMESIGAPAIAGLSDWYVQAQLEKFQNGMRGAHPDDVEGLRMRPMSRTLETESKLKAVASYVASLPAVTPDDSLPALGHPGDAEKGATQFQTCTACHGTDGTGDPNQKSPSLVRADDWYIFTQLKKFKGGVRGANPADEAGYRMSSTGVILLDTDEDMYDVIAHIRTLRN